MEAGQTHSQVGYDGIEAGICRPPSKGDENAIGCNLARHQPGLHSAKSQPHTSIYHQTRLNMTQAMPGTFELGSN